MLCPLQLSTGSGLRPSTSVCRHPKLSMNTAGRGELTAWQGLPFQTHQIHRTDEAHPALLLHYAPRSLSPLQEQAPSRPLPAGPSQWG